MAFKHPLWCSAVFLASLSRLEAQLPLIHYPFNEGGSPATTQNFGTVAPGPSPVAGMTLTGSGLAGSPCLTGAGGTTDEVTTPLSLNLGTGYWTVGFAINNSANPGGFQYAFSEDSPAGWRAFTNGAAGAGNIRLTGAGGPAFDIAGGAGDAGWVHVAWKHDGTSNVIATYLDGVLVGGGPAGSLNLSSGATLRIGRNGNQCLLNGTLIEDFRVYDYLLSTAEIASWAAHALASAPPPQSVKITEVSWGDPDGVEITNFGSASIFLGQFTIRWRDASGTNLADFPPGMPWLDPGHSLVVVENFVGLEPIPAAVTVLDLFATIGVSSGAITVGLVDEIGTVVDEVRVSDTSGNHPGWSVGGAFRGLATRTAGSGLSNQVGVERAWGLDSDSGTDWTEQPNRSFGRENRSSGPRGTDPMPLPIVRINEIDDNPDYIELWNVSLSPQDVSNWFLLCKAGTVGEHTKVTLPQGTSIPLAGYLVVGDGAAAPAELPAGVQYVDVTANLPFNTGELECALYDRFGRLMDLVRATGASGQLVQNHPRAPSLWSDFTGAAGRNTNGGDDASGRGPNGTDTNTGADFFPIYTRTMGSANLAATQAGPAGHPDALDVRVNETVLGGAFLVIINAGPASAGLTYNFFLSLTHSNGLGPFLGLGGDALVYFPAFYDVPPFSGPLDAQGSARIEFNPGSLPPGFTVDFVFFLQNAADALVARTFAVEFDT